MQMFRKQGLIFYAQADHLSGEILGSVIELLYEAGASNVQVVPTVTKKNRPAHIFLVDTRPQYADKIEDVLIRELRVTGWHRIDTEHRHLAVDYVKRPVKIQIGDVEFVMDVEGKIGYAHERTLRPEHRSMMQLKNELKDRGFDISLVDCNQCLLEILKLGVDEYRIDEEISR